MRRNKINYLKRYGKYVLIVMLFVMAVLLIGDRSTTKVQNNESNERVVKETDTSTKTETSLEEPASATESTTESETSEGSETEPCESTSEAEVLDKGYDLPIDANDQAEAESDCMDRMNEIKELYLKAVKGDPDNVRLTDQNLQQMQDVIQKAGVPVYVTGSKSDMANYETVDEFLQQVSEQKTATIVIYEVNVNGGLNRQKLTFDGDTMYVYNTNALFHADGTPYITVNSYSRIKTWEYTKKGWLIYDVCVPEPPEVTEVINGIVMFRVKPVNKEYREMAQKYVIPIAYQGNNLLCSSWDAKHLDKIDFNGLYEALYTMKYQKEFDGEQYEDGIPKEDFEQLMTEYLPVTREQLESYAVYDKEKETYGWQRLGCFNYNPNDFGIGVPEITDVKENEDGTKTLTIDAVCESAGDDCCITHKLTVRFMKNGAIQYLQNDIQGDGLNNIPEYQYRIP